jgi:chemotaxis-related protein WspD
MKDGSLPQAQAVVPSTPPLDRLACWRQIGVFGDRSCLELPKYIDCHNCPVHAAAGIELLNRALPPGYRRERSDYFARERDSRESSNFSALLFRIRAEWLALPTRALQEVTEFKTIHSLPHRRSGSVLGLANVRGELVICLSLPHLLGSQTGQPESSIHLAYHRLLVVQAGASRLAFPVHETHGPHRFLTDEINRLSTKSRTGSLGGTLGVLRRQDRVAGLLDADALLAACQRSLR